VKPALGIVLAALALAPGCVAPGTPALSVWAVEGARDLDADAAPLVETEVYSSSAGGIRLLAAANETIGLQLALRAGGASGALDVVFADLIGPAGRIDAAANIRRYRCVTTRVERYGAWYPAYHGATTPRDVFDALVPWETPRSGGPLRLERGRTEAVWVDLHIPPGTGAGTYEGQLRIVDAAGAAPFQCRVSVEVLPVELPPTPPLALVCRVDPRELLTAHLGWSVRSAEELRILPDEPSHAAARRLLDATMTLFHEHDTTPVLWGCFPKFQPTDPREVEVEWAPYDALVAGWLDGSAFADGVGLATWLVPASVEYPSAALHGGFETARYARVLAAYLAACRRHFEERGWSSRAVLRPAPPGGGGADDVDRMRRLTGIVTQSEVGLPVVAHLPLRTLRAFGWEGAPGIELPGVGVWCPPAGWLEPEAANAARALGDRVWFMPGDPPYSPSLAPEAGNAELLGWLAKRYGLQGMWIEHAADTGPGGAAPLVYPGKSFGVSDGPVGTVRLKRLRRAAQDYALLTALEERGAALLADRTARAVVRRALLDACNENLLSWRTGGWTMDPFAVSVARRVVLRELGGGSDATGADWSRVTQMSNRVDAASRGIRLTFTERGLTGRAFLEVTNELDRPISGTWSFPQPPTGWLPSGDLSVTAPAGGRGLTAATLDIGGLGYNAAGVAEFPVVLETQGTGEIPTTARVAVAACPLVDAAPSIDGDLRDWNAAANNVAGDFRLVRWPRGQAEIVDRPTLATQAYFCADAQYVYFGVWCALSGERPIWQSDNEVPIDGAIPWGQDVVEILLRPDGQVEGTGGDVYCLQIKPSGLLIAREGCRTEPPMNPSREWRCGARVAVQVTREAWVVEMALPLASLGEGAAGETIWGCNVTRLDARRGEYSSWSGAQGHCYSPQRLGNLVMLKP